MADDCVVVVDDDSRIITQLFLNTCRLLQPTVHHGLAVNVCLSAVVHRPTADDDEVSLIPLTTGSVAEFYIQPMLSCVGDIDVMAHSSDELAIPDGYPPPLQLPAEFHSLVEVYEIIDSEYPGYVYLVESYLLTDNTDTDTYDAEQYTISHYAPCHPIDSSLEGNIVIHGPARTIELKKHHTTVDGVSCVRCLWWPTQAADWPIRHRNYDWPDSATVERVVSDGCDVVNVAHRQCRQDEWMNSHQFRLSFSRAEIILLNSWMPVQQIVYHMLRVFLKTEGLTDIADHTGRKLISNYHIKTLMLWACELKPRSWWTDDLNVVRTSVVLLHTLADWLDNEICLHYFVNNCNILDNTLDVEIISSQLISITESWLSTWFIDNYLRKCAQFCPDSVSRLCGDVSTAMKLQNAVSAIVDWKLNSALEDSLPAFYTTEFLIISTFDYSLLNARTCSCWITELAKIDSCFSVYFIAVVFLHVAYETRKNGLRDNLNDVLVAMLGQSVVKRYSRKFCGVLSLSQAMKLMKVTTNNPRSTVQLIEIELSKAYLYRALRCKDSDSDSIYCLANVYLAVLYYITGQYQTAIDHCTLVTRSQDHSQCSSHVVQGELLPKIDDSIDTVLGLSVFYQYVRTAALNQQQQTQHVIVFTVELFAHYLHIMCLYFTNCRHFSQMYEVGRYIKSLLKSTQPFIADMLLMRSRKMLLKQTFVNKPLKHQSQISALNLRKLETSELVELLQQSSVEHLTTYRQLIAQKFGSVSTTVTTEFDTLYAYKRGDYQQCLQLSAQNVHTLLYGVLRYVSHVPMFPAFIQLMDENDIVSLTALTLIVKPDCRAQSLTCVITQLTLSLYLMTQCQLKLHHSVTSLSQTLHYIEDAQIKHYVNRTLDQMVLKLTERKILTHFASIM